MWCWMTFAGELLSLQAPADLYKCAIWPLMNNDDYLKYGNCKFPVHLGTSQFRIKATYSWFSVDVDFIIFFALSTSYCLRISVSYCLYLRCVAGGNPMPVFGEHRLQHCSAVSAGENLSRRHGCLLLLSVGCFSHWVYHQHAPETWRNTTQGQGCVYFGLCLLYAIFASPSWLHISYMTYPYQCFMHWASLAFVA